MDGLVDRSWWRKVGAAFYGTCRFLGSPEHHPAFCFSVGSLLRSGNGCGSRLYSGPLTGNMATLHILMLWNPKKVKKCDHWLQKLYDFARKGIFHSKIAMGASQIQISTSGAGKLMAFSHPSQRWWPLWSFQLFLRQRPCASMINSLVPTTRPIATEAIAALVRLQAGDCKPAFTSSMTFTSQFTQWSPIYWFNQNFGYLFPIELLVRTNFESIWLN